MVLPVLILIHWGMGRFCFSFLASLVLIRNVLRALILSFWIQSENGKGRSKGEINEIKTQT